MYVGMIYCYNNKIKRNAGSSEHLQTSVAFIMWQKEFWTKGIEPGTNEFRRLEEGVNQNMFTATAYPGTELWKTVRSDLKKHFDLNFDEYGDPICDDAFHKYVLELDDTEQQLKDIISKKLIFGISKKM